MTYTECDRCHEKRTTTTHIGEFSLSYSGVAKLYMDLCKDCQHALDVIIKQFLNPPQEA